MSLEYKVLNGDYMDGIINVLKPPKMTSHDVVDYFRSLFKLKKIGHAGTLDPDAVGVLPVCVGKATKVVQYLTNYSKKYRAELTLGISTDTQDSSGRIISKSTVNVQEKDIIDVINSFKGKINQTPPMFSAVKVGGKKLYQLARKGINVERKQREVEIYDIDIIKYDNTNNTVLFDVECSKGTYIRTLCSDIGAKLGCGGHMSFLLRLAVGPFDISSSLTLDKITEYYRNNQQNKFLKPIDCIFMNYPSITVKNHSLKWVLNGREIYKKDIFEEAEFDENSLVRVYDMSDNFLAIYKVKYNEGNTKFISDTMFV